jgi:hypothetical protein
MASEAELEIQQHLSSYLSGKLQRYEFEDWLIPTLWDLAESDDDVARELAGHINNLIAETSCGDRSMESLQEELTRIARPFGVRIVSIDYYSPADPCVISKPQDVDSGQPNRKPPQVAEAVGRVDDCQFVYGRG